jgi:hypothetical protein
VAGSVVWKAANPDMVVKAKRWPFPDIFFSTGFSDQKQAKGME